MTRARNQLISLETTPYYHVTSRCVRRAFLWGEDSLTGKSYEHRKGWVIERLRQLSEVFTIEICAYAIMSNHYHLVLRVDRSGAAALDESQVIERWTKLYNLPLLLARYVRGETKSAGEQDKAREIIDTWRQRLSDISWLMRSLNEHLAHRANEEDNCKGRFWEGRFTSQALLDEAAVLTCMSYVDLNPVRAGMAETPEESDFTSIQQRIEEYAQQHGLGDDAKEAAGKPKQTLPLMPLVKEGEDPHPNAFGFNVEDYLELVDWAGRAVRAGKRGSIKEEAPPILKRLGIEPSRYLEHVQGEAKTEQPTAIGHIEQITKAAQALGRKFLRGIGEAKRLYRTQTAT